MSRLLLAETERLFARRMTRFFPIGLAGVITAGVVIAFFVIENDDDNSPDFVGDMAGGVEAVDILGPLGALLPIMAFVIGSSSIGADIKTGMLEQLLTWEPRRLRFLTVRTIAASVGSALLAMLVAAVFVLELYVLAALTGTTDGTSGELWGNIALVLVRSGLAAGLFCAFGIGITLLLNNSIASIVGFVIYWFIVENILLSAFLPSVAVYTPVTNADAFARGDDVQRIEGSVFDEDFDLVDEHSYLVAATILVIWALVSIVIAAGVFRTRDIE